MQRLLFPDGDCRWRNVAVFRTGACRDDHGPPLHVPHAFQQIQGPHDIGLERGHRVRPRGCRQALRSHMKNVRRLVLCQDLRDSLPIAQIAGNELDVPQFWEDVHNVVEIGPDYRPALGMEKLNQVRPDESFSSGYQCDFFHVVRVGLDGVLSNWWIRLAGEDSSSNGYRLCLLDTELNTVCAETRVGDPSAFRLGPLYLPSAALLHQLHLASRLPPVRDVSRQSDPHALARAEF